MLLLLAAVLAIQVNVHPTAADEYQLLTRPTPDSYTCSVLVLDVASRKVVTAIPRIFAAAGRAENAKSPKSEYTVEFTVKIAPVDRFTAQTADTHVIVRHGDEVVSDQHSVITLLQSKSSNVPLR